MALMARIEHRTYFEVTGDAEKNEGRGGWYTVGFFASQDVAKRASKGHGVWGSDGQVRTHSGEVAVYEDPETHQEVIRPLGEAISIQYEDPIEVRKRALEKLTAEEKLALGLK